MMSIWSSLRDRWQAETDGAGLAVVRIAVALCVLTEMFETWISGDVTTLIVEPQVSFKYALFSWLGRPQGLMPYAIVWVMMGLAGAVMVGWRTRWTATLLAAGYAYWFLFDASNYSDHGYLVCLLTVLTAWLPTNRWASSDAYTGRESRTTVPGWTVELMRTQLILVYFFFGLALLNQDWLNGAPLIAWVETEAEGNAFARLLSGHTTLVRIVAWFLPLFNLSLGPLLIWKRTRLAALLVISAIHVFDRLTFEIGVSPLLLTAVSLIFLDPSGLRRFGNWLVIWLTRLPLSGMVWKVACRLGGLVDTCVSWFDDTPLWGQATGAPAIKKPVIATSPAKKPTTNALPTAKAPQWAIVLWLMIQVWLPVRFITLESNPDWTDLATTFAWRGQHRDKQCDLKMSVIQPSMTDPGEGLQWPLDPSEEFPVPMAIFYTEKQLESLGLSEGILKDLISGPEVTFADRIQSLNLSDAEAQRIVTNYRATVSLRLAGHQYEQLVQRPELIRQYAHRIADVLNPLLGERIQVQAEMQVKLNHRPAIAFFKDSSKLDLSRIKTAFEMSNHLTKVQTALPAPEERIAFAKEWAEQRRIELEQNFDIVSPKHPQQHGEPAKLPAFSDADERWFQEQYGSKS